MKEIEEIKRELKSLSYKVDEIKGIMMTVEMAKKRDKFMSDVRKALDDVKGNMNEPERIMVPDEIKIVSHAGRLGILNGPVFLYVADDMMYRVIGHMVSDIIKCELIKTTYGELAQGDVFCDDFERINDLYAYLIKLTGGQAAYWQSKAVQTPFYDDDIPVWKVVPIE